MSKGKKISILLTFVLMLVGAGWWIFGRESAQMRKVRQMQQEMMTAGKPPDQKTAELFFQEMDKLTPNEKSELGRGMFENMQNQRRKEMDAYFAMSKEEQEKFMDNRIKESEQRRKQMAANFHGTANGPRQGGPPPGGQAGQGGQRAPRGMGMPNSDQIKQFRNDILTHSSPQDRARGAAFMADEIKRRIAAGLPPFPGMPGR